jgi:hypothetical protein
MISNNLLAQYISGSIWVEGQIPFPCTSHYCSNNDQRISVRDAHRALRSTSSISSWDKDRIMSGDGVLHSHLRFVERKGYGMLTSFRITNDTVVLEMLKYVPYDPKAEQSGYLTDEVEEIVLDRDRLTVERFKHGFLQLNVEVARRPSKEAIKVNLKMWAPYM